MWATKRPGPLATGPQKKLILQGLKAIPALPVTFKDETWVRLQNAIRAIQASKPTAQGFEELYRDCENMCLHKLGSELYANLQGECLLYARTQLSEINKGQDETENGTVLTATRQFWTQYTQQLAVIRCVFLYLDRTYVLQTANTPSLWAMGLAVVRQCLEDSGMAVRLARLIVQEIARERDGATVDCAMLRVLTQMLVDLNLYSQYLVPRLIEATREHYERESRRMVGRLVPVQPAGAQSQMDVPLYLDHVKRRLAEETDRTAQYLSASTKSTLLATAVGELIEKHTDHLLATSFDDMLAQDCVADLGNLYTLLESVARLDTLKRHWAGYIKRTGMALVQQPDLDVALVTELLALKQRLDNVLAQSFAGSESLAHALREAFEEFINARRNRPTQLIAKFVDQCMRTGGRMAPDQALDALLDRVMVLFRFIQGKDMFEAFYKRDLAKRLLTNKSASKDAERAMLQRLKQECGAGFTNKLEGMFRDIEASEDLAGKFASSASAAGIGSMSFHASILAHAFWPTYEPMDLVVPKAAEEAQNAFTEFYGETHQGRNLQWQPMLGTCLLKVEFDEGPKELALSVVQGTVLCLFGEADELSYTEIQQNTSLDDATLQRTLQSLACGKTRVLTKEPKGKNVDSTDRFIFNKAFSSPQARIKISQIQTKGAEKETKDTEERVQFDRMYKVDAAIVRIMKARRTLSYTDLLTEIMAQLKFNASATELKKRIDSLLEREFLERDDNDQSVYKYVA